MIISVVMSQCNKGIPVLSVEGGLSLYLPNVGFSTLVSKEIDFVLLDKKSHQQLMTALFVYVTYGDICPPTTS